LRQRLGISALFPCLTSIPPTASVVTIAGEEAGSSMNLVYFSGQKEFMLVHVKADSHGSGGFVQSNPVQLHFQKRNIATAKLFGLCPLGADLLLNLFAVIVVIGEGRMHIGER
jgi:hypothetical protein